jgi:hypothetical protein
LESDARDAAGDFIVILYFSRNSFGVVDEQRTGAAHGVEPRPDGRRPAVILADPVNVCA